MTSTLQRDVGTKAHEQRLINPNNRELAVADPENVGPLREFFAQQFQLLAGEYRLRIELIGDVTLSSKEYDFTIFESEEQFFRDVVEDYKYGAGVYFEREDKNNWLIINMRERD